MKLLVKALGILTVGAFILVNASCKKYLDKKPNNTLLIPGSLADLQTMLDSYNIMNNSNSGVSEVVAGDIYVTSTDFSSQYAASDRLFYVWDKDANLSDAWDYNYKSISYANIVLDELAKIKISGNQVTYNDLKGQALFFRSFYLWQLAQVYCKPYSSATAIEPGIALRLTSDINESTTRATVQQTYNRIVEDLKQAVELLPKTSISPVRPNRSASFAMLARVYLSMNDFINAGKYADSSLQIKNTLLDYNSLTASSGQPIPKMNIEVLFHATGGSYTIVPPIAKVDSLLYNSYDNDDLRKQIFFSTNADNSHSFKGSYGSDNSFIVFHGLSVDEMYLTRAESAAKAGNKDAALEDLNTLIQKRWKNTVAYPTITAVDANEALNKVLTERRKELLYRSLRWTDLRRRNLEGENISLKRVVNNTTYALPPNDPRWVLLIPLNIINISGIEQNPR
jgi:starch-binding outer membrane protein, SusD/RagB family